MHLANRDQNITLVPDQLLILMLHKKNTLTDKELEQSKLGRLNIRF